MSDRNWAVRKAGEILFEVTGPDAESMARAAARAHSGVLIFRDDERPTEANGWRLHGPWQDTE